MNKISKLLLVGSFAMTSAMSQAYTIDAGTVDVGELDSILGTADMQSLVGSNYEDKVTSWVNSFDGIDGITYTVKNETIDVYETNDEDVFAFDLSTEPGYYIIKNGNENPDMVLIQNTEQLSYGVLNYWTLSDLGLHLGDMWDEGGFLNFQISHVTEFNGATVPEPATFGLLILGLAGLGAARRKTRS